MYFEACGALEGTDDDDRLIIFERIRFKPLSKDSFSSLMGAQGERFVGENIVLHQSTMESLTRLALAFVNSTKD